jgi:dTDP-4-dehydrorhamnose reductase
MSAHQSSPPQMMTGLSAASPPSVLPPLELWLGVECTLNRVQDRFLNQLGTSGHDRRLSDLDQFAQLGARRIRYPVLWEQVVPDLTAAPDWRWTDERLGRLRELGLMPIATLLHHGSGPPSTSLLHPDFPEQLAAYARQVAERYPWVCAYTPVNEPLTTARFSGLYGIWYPHHAADTSFVRALLNECRGTVLAMQAIREVNPGAELIQTDDLGKAHATPAMQAEADFQNERRWLAYDLLCGRVDEHHALWSYLRSAGASAEELHWFVAHPCPPDVIGVDYYVTSERFLDERKELYSPHQSNATHADIEAVRVYQHPAGILPLLREAWNRYSLPVAVTEAHLGSTREEQLRWFETFWQAAQHLRAEGADIRAVTSWAVLGSFDWNTLHTELQGHYEPGAFDVRSSPPRPTALAKLLQLRAAGQTPAHPCLDSPGFWERPDRFFYTPVGAGQPTEQPSRQPPLTRSPRPVLIVGQGRHLQGVSDICDHRGLACRVVALPDLEQPESPDIRSLLDTHRPWAVIHLADDHRMETAQQGRAANELQSPTQWAQACAERRLPLLTFSAGESAGEGAATHLAEHTVSQPSPRAGAVWEDVEQWILAAHPQTLIVRNSALLGQAWWWEVGPQRSEEPRTVNSELHCSPASIAALLHQSLDLLIDGETDVWHLVHQGERSWLQAVQPAHRRAWATAGRHTQGSRHPLEALAGGVARPRRPDLGGD